MPARGAEPDRLRSLSLRHGESVQQHGSCQDMFPSSWLNRTSYAINRESERVREKGRESASSAKKEGKDEGVVMNGGTSYSMENRTKSRCSGHMPFKSTNFHHV